MERNETMTVGSDQYTAVVSSVQYGGEATLAIEDNGLKISSLFFDQFVGYEEINSVKAGDYTVEIVTEEDRICCSRMGNSGDWFAARLLKSYNRRVTSALMADGGYVFETKGSMAYETVRSDGTIHVFRDCVCLLPPGKEARRVPFAFLCSMKAENYALSMRLTTGETYTLSMLGRDLEPLEKCIKEQILQMRSQNVAFIGSLCEELSASQQTKATGIMPQKIAVPWGKLGSVPVLQQSVMGKIQNSRMQETWDNLLELCDGEKVCVGVWELPEEEVERLKAQLLEKMSGQGEEGGEAANIELTPEQEDALRWMIWAAVPSKDGKTVVVEYAFPNEAAATYVYHVSDGWENFLPVLNRAMEAADFDREVILMPEEKLYDGTHPLEQMLVQRTSAIVQLRQQLAGRVIHRSLSGWKDGLKKYLES